MLYQHVFPKPVFKKRPALRAVPLLRRTAVYICLLTLCTGLHIAATGQQAQSQLNYTLRVDPVGKINTSKLSNKRKQQSREYVEFLSGKSISSAIYPYYPYTPINFKNLPTPPFRVYLGKLTAGDANDFVLIAVHCTAIKVPLTQGTGPAPQGSKIKYVDDVSPGTNQADVANNWFSIRVRKTTGATDSVIYQRTTKKTATQYKDNFKTFLKAKKIDLPRTYPLCFVVRSNRKGKLRLQIQPVLVKNTLPSSPSGGAQHWKKWIFQDGRVVVFLGEFDTVNAADNDTCCQTPPEEGNSIQDN